MNRKTKAILLLAILTLSYTAVLPATAHTEDDPFVTDLLAGQNMDAGDVLVWNDGDYLYVKYVAAEGWMISETHLHIAMTLTDIPQKNDNPIPGQFDYNTEHDPWVSEYTYQVELTWDIDDELYIAAHAVVKDLVNVGEYCIDFESYNEYDTVDTVNTPAGPVTFYMTDYTSLGSLSIGDYAPLSPTGDLPTVAAPNTITPDYNNIVAFTVGSNPYIDDWVKDDPYDTGAGGNTLTDTPDYSQTPLQQHAVSKFQAVLVDLSQVEDLLGLSFAGVDLDWGETWYIDYFNSENIAVDIQTVDATPYGQSMDGNAIPITNTNMDIAKFVIWGSMNIGTPGRVGFAIDNICVETAGEETAWGAGFDFPGKNWALYLKYTVQGEVPVYWPGEAGTMTVAFEDLPLGGSLDWDYNDFVVDIDTLATYYGTTQDNGLQQMDFTVTPEARGAGYNHEFHLMIPADTFLSNGEYTLTIYDENDDPLPGYPVSGSFDATLGNDYIVIPSTTIALPGTLTNTIEPTGIVSHYPTLTNTDPNAPQHQPYVPTKRTATLTISFETLEDFDFSAYDPYSGYHGEGLFFDPYLRVLNTGNNIHAGDVRMLTVPVDWMWPEAGVGIWLAYPDVSSGAPPTFAPDWWNNYNDLVYDGKPSP